MTTRVNLLPNPSFRADISGYTGIAGATLSLDTTDAFYGVTSMLVTKDAQNNSGVSADPVAVTPGLSYAFSSYVLVPETVPATETANLIMTVLWYSSSNMYISDSVSALNLVAPSEDWTRLTGVATAPSGAATAVITVTQLVAGTAGETFLLDALLFEQADYVGGFIDNLPLGEINSIANIALTPLPIPPTQTIQLLADITLGDLVLNTIDENNVVWLCTDLTGWWGQAESDIPDIPRGILDGSYDVEGRYDARTITLTGTLIPPDPSLLGVAKDTLIGATNLVRQGAWLVTDEDPSRAAFVRLSGQPTIQTTNARGRTDFQIPLKAADPIRYEWNDEDPNGYTSLIINAGDAGTPTSGTVTNIGNTNVTTVLTINGPLGPGSTVYNALTNETLTTAQELRGAGSVGSITGVQLFNNVATISTSNATFLVVGDQVVVSGTGFPFDTTGNPWTVTAVSNIAPYTFSYACVSANVNPTTVSGQAYLAYNDVLLVDTYARNVTYNGNIMGNRNKVATLTDWPSLDPGDNVFGFTDNPTQEVVQNKAMTNGKVTLTTAAAHYFNVGEEVVVTLPTTAQIAQKSLTSNVVTLATSSNHGFSVGDSITVNTTQQSTVVNKALASDVATLTTATLGAFSVSDSVTVALPATATVSSKTVTSDVATLTTPAAHGFSVGDAITVTLQNGATITNKVQASNIATLTTATAHGFSVGDTVTVVLDTSATVVDKYTSGSVVVLTTSAAHGFSVGDNVTVAFPTTATLTNSRSMSGSSSNYYVTLNTSAAHGFSTGDLISVNIGITSTMTVTNRSATTGVCTLTIGTHGFSVGETITVSGVSNSQYNGTSVISSVTSTTITYASSSATAESSTSSSGTVVNNTIATGYNGNKIIETVPTTTSFTYRDYNQAAAISSTATGSGATLTNNSNVNINGTYAIASVPSSTQFSYNS